MPNSYSDAIRQQAAKTPACWKPDYRLQVAKQIVDSNAQYEVNSSINQFALDAALPQSSRSPDQMPVQSSNMSAALPANLTQQGGAADQIDPQHIADFVAEAYHRFSPAEQDQLCQLLGDLVDAHNTNNGEAQDQGGVTWAPRGWGASGNLLTSPQQSRGGSNSWSEEPWRNSDYGQPGGPPMSSQTRPNGDRAARDQRRRFDARPNRMMGGRDRRMSQDAALPQQSFLERWPMAAHIKFSANGRY